MEPLGGHSATVRWDPGPRAQERLNALFKRYRTGVGDCLEPIVRQYNPMMLEGGAGRESKMLELSAKMNVVGHACAEIGGFEYDERRQMIGSLLVPAASWPIVSSTTSARKPPATTSSGWGRC